MVGKLEKVAISSGKRSTVPFQSARVRFRMAMAAGTSASVCSRTCGSSGALTPPGTVHEGCTRSRASRSMTVCPNLRSAMPSRRASGCSASRPATLRVAGSWSMPNSRSGAERWKKESACDCTIWAQWSSSRSMAAVAGMRTAMMASQALDEASRWLTGQMPQMRAVMAGIS